MADKGNDEMKLDYKPTTKPPNIYDSKFWPNVRPFVEGGLVGVMINIPDMAFSLGGKALLKLTATYRNYFHHHDFFYQDLGPFERELVAKFFKVRNLDFMKQEMVAELDKKLSEGQNRVNTAFKHMPSMLGMATLQSAMLFGPYGFLTRKVQAANKGIPPSLCQDLGCCLISGAIGASVNVPPFMSWLRNRKANTTQTRIFHDLYSKAAKEGTLALWKGGRDVGITLFSINLGMLASYNRSYEYLRKSIGLSANKSVLGAGLLSGLFASTFSFPFLFVRKTMTDMKPCINGQYPYTSYLDCVFKILKIRGPLAFYSGSTRYILPVTAYVTASCYCLEKVRGIEKSFGW